MYVGRIKVTSMNKCSVVNSTQTHYLTACIYSLTVSITNRLEHPAMQSSADAADLLCHSREKEEN